MKKCFFSLLLLFFGWHNAFAINIQQWDTQNGAKIFFLKSNDLKIVDIRLVFDAGSARDGKKLGLAKLVNTLIPTGTTSKNEDEIALAFDNQGAIFSHSSLIDMSIFSLRTLSSKEQLQATTDILSDLLLNPSFKQEPFKRVQDTTIQGLKIAKQSPSYLASRAFMETLYPEHPYSTNSSGTIDSVKSIIPQDLSKFHQKYFVGNNAIMVIVGDLNMLQAKSLANKVVGKLPPGKKPETINKVKPLDKAMVKKIEFDSQQTHILIGQPGVSRRDPDYFPLYVGNHILGGSGLVSRLSNEIREKHGLAYSAYSYFSPMRQLGPFQMGTQTKTKSTDKALKIARETLQDFVNNGPSEKELSDSKKNISGGFVLQIDSNSKITQYLAMIGFYNLPLDYLDTLVNKVNQVTVEDIKTAWQKRIKPENMATILVGKFKK